MTSYFPAEPARRALRQLAADPDNTIVDIAVAAGIDRCTLQRLFTRARLRYDAADNIAVALGYHPCELWPEWFPPRETQP
jgi:lambda repressor-like predicted transcriptional regulator